MLYSTAISLSKNVAGPTWAFTTINKGIGHLLCSTLMIIIKLMYEYVYIILVPCCVDYKWEHRGVMVIVVGIGHDDTSSNARRNWLHFT